MKKRGENPRESLWSIFLIGGVVITPVALGTILSYVGEQFEISFLKSLEFFTLVGGLTWLGLIIISLLFEKDP